MKNLRVVSVLLVFLALAAGRSAAAVPYTSNALMLDLLAELTNSLPSLNPLVCAEEAAIISRDPNCANAPDAPNLSDKLKTSFQGEPQLDWADNQAVLMTTATNVAADIFPVAKINPVAASLKTEKLAAAIAAALQDSLPASANLTAVQIALESGIIAQGYGGSDDPNVLEAYLVSSLSSDAALNLPLPANLALINRVSSQITSAIYPPAPSRTATFPKSEYTNTNSLGSLFLWTGAKFRSPYTINQTASGATLQSSGNDTSPYIEFAFDTSYILRSNPTHDDDTYFGLTPPYQNGNLQVLWPFSKWPDIKGSFGYIFGNNSSPSNYTASTIAGTSDVYGQGSVGFPVLRFWNTDSTFLAQATLEASGGFSTDKEFDAVHPNMFFGGGFEARISGLLGTNNYSAYWFSRAGMARIDQPKLTANGVVFSNNGGLNEPVFDTTWIPSIETDLIVPVPSTSLSLQAGADVYFSSMPGNWDITIGVSLDLSKLAKGIESTLVNSQ